MAEISLEHNVPQVLDVLNGLLHRVEDLSEPMAGIAAVMESASERAFAEQATPAGDPWADLTDTTKARRAANGHWPGQILQVRGQLAASIETDSGKDFAQIGSNKVYAPTMYFGAAKGEFGKTKRNAPIPWGDIPGREFVGLGQEDELDILDILGDGIVGPLGGE